MKTKLLLVVPFLSLLCAAQSPITSFYLGPSDFPILSPTPPLDQTATGANATWDFTALTQIGTSVDNNLLPTNEEIAIYPNTNAITVNTSTIGALDSESKIYSTAENSGQVSITGIINSQFELNFAEDNALVGTFPLNYGYSNSDTVAGTYIFGANSGTFTGNFVTSVDSYGTLISDIPSGGNLPVTRLKTVLTINLNDGILANIGTITQTNYRYYSYFNLYNESHLVFRTSTTVSLVPSAGIDQTDSIIERSDSWFNIAESTLQNTQLQVVPNPASNQVNVVAAEGINIESILVMDANGRVVLNPNNNEKAIDVSQLQKGIYFAKVLTDKGTVTKKIIKE